jgi:hypothetical protein
MFGPVYLAWRDVEKSNRSKHWKRTQLIIGTLMSLIGALIAAWGGSASSLQEPALITGGDGFCYLTVYNFSTISPIETLLINASAYPLYDVGLTVFDEDEPVHPMMSGGQINGAGLSLLVGTLSPHATRNLGIGFSARSGLRRFEIFFGARNGIVSEKLRVAPSDNSKTGICLKALRVSRDNRVILEQVDTKFPRGSDGKVEW